ncbi:FecR family protein [Tistrella mobilis]|uniref:FecR n=1 Tax=Tistrella mobilis (strain KA081020-065) TaxID=1110502 RepID=I3TP52_TISMK|nr:FecR domain-containing protein [Tistrella mobilis]AFK54540.1 putative FecR [Tistrella mobilis KA081020-065]
MAEDPVLEAAFDWLLQLQEAPDDPAIRAGWAAWRRSDPAHEAAWARVCATWRDLGEAGPLRGAPVQVGPAPVARDTGVVPPRRALRRRAMMAAAAVVVAMVAVASVRPGGFAGLGADAATGVAETRRVVLDDGSRVELDGRTAIRSRFDDGRREVTLIDGGAFFDVMPDPARPFIVRAGDVAVTVTGTTFDVAADGGRVVVEVASGTVRVAPARGRRVEQLAAGDRLAVDTASGAVTRGRLAPEDVGAWRDGRLFVSDATVAEVVAELRRHQPGWIVITDAALGARRVTGLYDLRDPQRALKAMMRPVGGEVRAFGPLLTLVTAGG